MKGGGNSTDDNVGMIFRLDLPGMGKVYRYNQDRTLRWLEVKVCPVFTSCVSAITHCMVQVTCFD